MPDYPNLDRKNAQPPRKLSIVGQSPVRINQKSIQINLDTPEREKEVYDVVELQILENEQLHAEAEQIYVHWDRVRKFMDFIGMSFATLSRKSCTPESTLRKLMQGVTKDPRVSTLQPILKALGADANIVLGLAPARDYDKEIKGDNIPLTDALRQHLDAVRAERDDAHKELTRLRKMILEKEGAMCRLEGRTADAQALARQCADQQERLERKANKIQEQAEKIATLTANLDACNHTISNLEFTSARQRTELKWLMIALCVLAALLISVLGYAAWELSNPDIGLIKWR